MTKEDLEKEDFEYQYTLETNSVYIKDNLTLVHSIITDSFNLFRTDESGIKTLDSGKLKNKTELNVNS